MGMNKIAETIFRYKKAVLKKLPEYGFEEEGGGYVYRTQICDNQMRLIVRINVCGEVETEVFDTETEEPYTLFLVDGAVGEFVGKVRSDYAGVLEDIAEKCFEREVFKGAHTQPLIEYVREKYGDELEFLWEKTPDCAVWRRKDNRKWYAAILTVRYSKLGIEREGTVEIIDMRMDPTELEKAVDDRTYYRGYHMNKKHWVTMLLDGSAPYDELVRRLDESYALAKK